LEQVPTQPQQLRRFEYHYLKRQFEGGIFTLSGHRIGVYSVAFSPDGMRLATGDFDTARLWDARTGALLFEVKGQKTGAVVSLAFSPDGTRLAGACQDKTARLWDAHTGALIREFKGHTDPLLSVAFSPDGTRLATSSGIGALESTRDNTARLWDARTGAMLLVLQGHAHPVNSVAFSPDGMRLLTGSNDWTARLWDARTGAPLLQLKEHKSGVQSVAFSPDGTRLATGSSDGTTRLWDARTGAPQLQLKATCKCLVFSPDGSRLAICGGGSSLSGDRDVNAFDRARVWDARTGQVLMDLKGHTGTVACVAFSPDGTCLATGSFDKTARLWDARTEGPVLELKGLLGVVDSVAFSPDGKYLASGSRDRTARLWDARTGAFLREFKGHTHIVACVAFSPDGKHLASASFDKTARVWDLETGACQLVIRVNTEYLTDVVYSPDGAVLATCGGDNKARLWNARTGAALHELTGKMYVGSVAFSPDGKRLATADCQDKTAKIWDVRTGAKVLELKGHAGDVLSVAFSPDGTRVATSSGSPLHDAVTNDNSARLWDSETGKELIILKGHADQVLGVAFSPDSTRLATVSFDNTVRLWDVRTGAGLLELKGHAYPVRSVAFSPNGTRLATAGSFDHTVRIWDASPVPAAAGELDADELARRLWVTNFDRVWHEQQLGAKRQAGDGFAALYHAAQLLPRQPGDKNLLTQARQLVDEAAMRDPKNPVLLGARARLLLEDDRIYDFRKTCADLANLAADGRDDALLRRLATTCLLAPQALPDLKPTLTAFEKSLCDKYPEDLRIHGGLLLRSGRAEESIKRLEEARKGEKETPFEDLLLALAYHQLKAKDKAEECLARAKAVLDGKQKTAQHLISWEGWLELQVLRREVEELLQPSGGQAQQPELKPLTNSIGMKLAPTPAGKFLMGSPNDEPGRKADESPQREVHITRPFYMGVHHVTVGQFRAFVKATGYKTDAEKSGGALRLSANGWITDPKANWDNPFFEQTDEHPVVCVSWNDAKAFCDWLSAKEGKRYALPTEAQWEYACRAGSRTRYFFGNDDKDLAEYAWYSVNSGKKTHPVGQKKANAWGLHDMYGQVWQWTADWYAADFYQHGSGRDPAGPASGRFRVLRGSDWSNDSCRSAQRRGEYEPVHRFTFVGFRVILLH
jgi:WD40 repeat protein/formylglycine-generating enzyme required for sulfatase activity